MRLNNGRDDFSEWLGAALGEKELAGKIRALDAFMNSLEEIRAHMIQEVAPEIAKGYGGHSTMIDTYAGIAPKGELILLKRMGERLKGRTFLHVNSTKAGGGVAEILQRMVPLLPRPGNPHPLGSYRGR